MAHLEKLTIFVTPRKSPPPAEPVFMRLRAPQKIFHFFEKKLLTIFQVELECPQIEATTAETKTKNQNEK